MMQPASERNDRFDRPRFRQDLLAELIDDQGGRFIDVMDPDSGSLFRFYEVEYSLACGMDGERDVSGIVKWAQDELGLSASQQEVRNVISTLGDLGFIEAGEVAPRAPAPELAPGVVVGAQPMAPAIAAVELGASGAAAPRSVPAPTSAAVDLGAAGAVPAAQGAVEAVDEVSLAATGRGPAPTPSPLVASAPAGTSEVSIDLADHMAVRPDDVKEAVRASKVMAAVEVPPELLAAIEKPVVKPAEPAAKAAEPVAAKAAEAVAAAEPVAAKAAEAVAAAEPVAAKAAEAVATAAEPVAAKAAEPVPAKAAEPVAAKAAEPVAKPAEPAVKPPVTKAPEARPPVELPPAPAPAEKAAVPPPAPSSGMSPALVVLLILVLLGGAAFLVWKFVLDKPATEVGSADPQPTQVKPVEPPAPPPAAPEPTAKVAMEAPAPVEIKLGQPAVIETILADGAAVKDGDVIVKLVGGKPIEAEIAGLTRELKRVQDQVDAAAKRLEKASAAGNKTAEAAAQADLADRQKSLAAKKEQLTAKTAELDKFAIHAAGNGTFSPVAKLGQKLAADVVVAKVQYDAAPVATFKVTDTKPYSVDGHVDLLVGTQEHVTCKVTELQPDGIKVGCPASPALTDGAEVALKGPAAAPAPVAEAPAAGSGDSDNGSAAGPSGSPDPSSAAAGGTVPAGSPEAAKAGAVE